jgi:hypothetical protein
MTCPRVAAYLWHHKQLSLSSTNASEAASRFFFLAAAVKRIATAAEVLAMGEASWNCDFLRVHICGSNLLKRRASKQRNC